MATLQEAVQLAQMIEATLDTIPDGPWAHVAVAGGCLVSPGFRKDIDILLYPHDPDKAKKEVMFWEKILARIQCLSNFYVDHTYKSCAKCRWHDIPVDLLFADRVYYQQEY